MTRHVYPIHWPGLSIEALVTHDTGRGDPDDLVSVVTPGRTRLSVLKQILEGQMASIAERDR